MTLHEARKAVIDACTAFDTAAQGPSGDAEHAAAVELRDLALGLVEASAGVVPPIVDDPVAELFNAAQTAETDVLQDLMRRAGWLWQCPSPCGWDNPAAALACEGCGALLLDVCQHGDPDPTPDTPEDEWCKAVSPDLTFACTRHGVHPTGTQHVAGNGAGQVAAVWPNNDDQKEAS